MPINIYTEPCIYGYLHIYFCCVSVNQYLYIMHCIILYLLNFMRIDFDLKKKTHVIPELQHAVCVVHINMAFCTVCVPCWLELI